MKAFSRIPSDDADTDADGNDGFLVDSPSHDVEPSRSSGGGKGFAGSRYSPSCIRAAPQRPDADADVDNGAATVRPLGDVEQHRRARPGTASLVAAVAGQETSLGSSAPTDTDADARRDLLRPAADRLLVVAASLRLISTRRR